MLNCDIITCAQCLGITWQQNNPPLRTVEENDSSLAGLHVQRVMDQRVMSVSVCHTLVFPLHPHTQVMTKKQ